MSSLTSSVGAPASHRAHSLRCGCRATLRQLAYILGSQKGKLESKNFSDNDEIKGVRPLAALAVSRAGSWSDPLLCVHRSSATPTSTANSLSWAKRWGRTPHVQLGPFLIRICWSLCSFSHSWAWRIPSRLRTSTRRTSPRAAAGSHGVSAAALFGSLLLPLCHAHPGRARRQLVAASRDSLLTPSFPPLASRTQTGGPRRSRVRRWTRPSRTWPPPSSTRSSTRASARTSS